MSKKITTRGWQMMTNWMTKTAENAELGVESKYGLNYPPLYNKLRPLLKKGWQKMTKTAENADNKKIHTYLVVVYY